MVFRPRGSSVISNKRFPPPGVGNIRDSEKGANDGGDFDRRNFQMSESPRSACVGTLVIHIDWCIKVHTDVCEKMEMPNMRLFESYLFL